MLQLYRTNLPINKDKFLGFREATGYGFYRNLVGQQEKFLIQKAASRGVLKSNNMPLSGARDLRYIIPRLRVASVSAISTVNLIVALDVMISSGSWRKVAAWIGLD